MARLLRSDRKTTVTERLKRPKWVAALGQCWFVVTVVSHLCFCFCIKYSAGCYENIIKKQVFYWKKTLYCISRPNIKQPKIIQKVGYKKTPGVKITNCGSNLLWCGKLMSHVSLKKKKQKRTCKRNVTKIWVEPIPIVTLFLF